MIEYRKTARVWPGSNAFGQTSNFTYDEPNANEWTNTVPRSSVCRGNIQNSIKKHLSC